MLDNLDLKILDELRKHGYQNATFLAPKVGLGVHAVRRRLKRMKSTDTFKVTTIPDPVAFGYDVWVQVGIKVELGFIDSIISRLIEYPFIYFVGKGLNEYDIWISAFFENNKNLFSFINSELIRITGVLETETMQMIRPKKYYHLSWRPVEDSNNETQNGYKPDITDQKIVRIMQQDGLIPLEELKDKLGLGESTTRKRVRNLLSRGFASRMVIPNPDVIRSEFFGLIGIKINKAHADKALETIIEKWDVNLASHCLGQFNLLIGASFHSIENLSNLVSTGLPIIKGIKVIKSFILAKPIKYHGINW